MRGGRQRGSRRKATPRPGNVVEALSAKTRRCRDMESHSCDFHVGGGDVGVTGRGRGRLLGCTWRGVHQTVVGGIVA